MQKTRKNRAALRLPCLAALFCGLLLEGLAGLEDGDGGRRDLDGFLRLGVAAHARLALLRLKAAEADERADDRECNESAETDERADGREYDESAETDERADGRDCNEPAEADEHAGCRADIKSDEHAGNHRNAHADGNA